MYNIIVTVQMYAIIVFSGDQKKGDSRKSRGDLLAPIAHLP